MDPSVGVEAQAKPVWLGSEKGEGVFHWRIEIQGQW
jgi:hypothetical protein